MRKVKFADDFTLIDVETDNEIVCPNTLGSTQHRCFRDCAAFFVENELAKCRVLQGSIGELVEGEKEPDEKQEPKQHTCQLGQWFKCINGMYSGHAYYLTKPCRNLVVLVNVFTGGQWNSIDVAGPKNITPDEWERLVYKGYLADFVPITAREAAELIAKHGER